MRRGSGSRAAGLVIAAALLLAEAAGAQAPPAPLSPEAAAAATLCVGAAEQATALKAEKAELNRTIGDIALGRNRRRRKPSGGEVAGAVAGTAASVLLPFGIGALLSAGAGAAAKGARKKGRKPAPPEPDVPAMIDRLHAIDARLAMLASCG